MGSILVEFSVSTDTCPLVALTKRFSGTELEYLEMAQVERNRFLEVFEVRGPQVPEYQSAMEKMVAGKELRVLDVRPDRLTAQVALESQCIRSHLARNGWIPLKVHAKEGQESLTVVVGDGDEAARLLESVQRDYHGFQLRRVVPVGDLQHSSRWGLSDFGLTGRQAAAVTAALDGGYFDTPRARNSGEIAADMGVDRSTFTRNLRAGIHKVLDTLTG